MNDCGRHDQALFDRPDRSRAAVAGGAAPGTPTHVALACVIRTGGDEY
jgi:hypothetical protein